MAERYYTAESLEPQRSIGFLLKRCGILMMQTGERIFASQPISLTQWQILMMLSQRPHASPTEISEYLGHDMGALTRVVDELHELALVRRERSQRDRRAVEIAITAEGRKRAAVGKQVVAELLNEMVEPLSEHEIEVLITLLNKLMVRMQEVQKTTVAATASAPVIAPVRRGTRRAPRTARGIRT